MIVLGFDTATSSTAVGLRLADGRVLEARDDPQPGAHPGHATRLLEMARGLLEEAAIGWRELDLLGVGIGPGTFTGLRVGVATARGLSQSLGIELTGVSSLQALARGAAGSGEALAGVLAVIDARRSEVFAGAYAADGQELLTPRAVAPALLHETLAEAGLGESPWLAVGDGAVRYREAIAGGGVEMPEDPSPLHRLGGRAICELAALRAGGGPVAVLPDYRRRPDAELALAATPNGGAAS